MPIEAQTLSPDSQVDTSCPEPDEALGHYFSGWILGYQEATNEYKRRISTMIECIAIGVLLAFLIHLLSREE